MYVFYSSEKGKISRDTRLLSSNVLCACVKEYNDMYMAGIVMGYRLNARWLVNKDVAYGSCDLMIT